MNRNLRTTRSVILTKDQHFHSYGEGRKVGVDNVRASCKHVATLGFLLVRCSLESSQIDVTLQPENHRTGGCVVSFLERTQYYTQRRSRTGLFYKVILLGRPNQSSPISCKTTKPAINVQFAVVSQVCKRM